MTESSPFADQVQVPVLFRLMADRIPGFVWSTDIDLRITAAFGAGLAALNIPPHQYLGKTLFEFFESTDENRPGVAVHRRALRGEVVDYEGTFLNRVFRAHIEPLRDDANRILGCIGFAQDITEQRRAEDELRRSEAKWRAVIDNAPAQVSTVDRQGTILFINRPAPGLTLAQVIGSSVYDYLQPEHREQARQCVEYVFGTGETVVNESQATGPYGTVAWYETRLGPVKVDGQTIAVTLVSSDVTERKQAEADLQQAHDDLEQRVADRTSELHAANRRLQAEVEQRRQAEERLTIFGRFVDAATQGFGMADADGRILFVNPYLARLFGRQQPDDVIGTCVADYYPDSYQLRRTEEILPALRRGEPWRGEQLLRFPDGQLHPTIHTIFPVQDADGELAWTAVIITDITDLRRAEAALRQSYEELRASQERFELAVRAAGVGIWDWDLTTGKVFYSGRWKSLFGYRDDEIGEGFDDWASRLHPEERESIIKAQEDFLASPLLTITAEYRFRHRDGSYRWISAHALAVRDEQGRARRLVGSHGDITDRKRAEEQVQAQQRSLRRLLQASDHDREMITFEIHDGVAQRLLGALLQFDAYDGQAAHESEKLKTIFAAGMQALREAAAEARSLMNRTRTPVLQKFGIKAALADFIDNVSERPNAPEIMYRCEVSFSRLAPVIENAIFRIAQEAITNACRHSHGDMIRVALIQDGEDVTLEVQDNGVGFDPAAVAAGRFGLHGMRERARSFGQELQVDSGPGRGTRIRATFPVIQPEDFEP